MLFYGSESRKKLTLSISLLTCTAVLAHIQSKTGSQKILHKGPFFAAKKIISKLSHAFSRRKSYKMIKQTASLRSNAWEALKSHFYGNTGHSFFFHEVSVK